MTLHGCTRGQNSGTGTETYNMMCMQSPNTTADGLTSCTSQVCSVSLPAAMLYVRSKHTGCVVPYKLYNKVCGNVAELNVYGIHDTLYRLQE